MSTPDPEELTAVVSVFLSEGLIESAEFLASLFVSDSRSRLARGAARAAETKRALTLHADCLEALGRSTHASARYLECATLPFGDDDEDGGGSDGNDSDNVSMGAGSGVGAGGRGADRELANEHVAADGLVRVGRGDASCGAACALERTRGPHLARLRAALALERRCKWSDAEQILGEVEDVDGCGWLAAAARLAARVDSLESGRARWRAALLRNAWCVEGYIALIATGSSFQDLLTFNPPAFLVPVLEALHGARWPSGPALSARIAEVAARYPDNAHLVAARADGLIQRSRLHEAASLYERLRAAEPAQVQYMDSLASLLRQIGQPSKLCQLSHDLLELDPSRPEPWITATMFMDMRDAESGSSAPASTSGKAMEYVERAIALDPLHENAYLVKGNICLRGGDHDASLEAYRAIYALRRSLEIFEGMVYANLQAGRVKDALIVAREALHRAPRNARALTLVGRVLSWGAEGRAKAHKAFTNALTVDPSSEDAVIGLAELLVVEDKVPEALQLLSSQVQQRSTEQLHLKLAEVLLVSSNHSEALIHLHVALAKNPHSAQAKALIERVDRIIKGEDGSCGSGEEEPEEGDSGDGTYSM